MDRLYRRKSYVGRDGKSHRCEEGTCLRCHKVFYAIKDFKNRKQKWCSRKCWNKRNPPTKNNCLICGKEFESYQRGKKYCSFECRNKGMTGRKLSEVVIKKMSDRKKGKIPKNHWQKGELHPFWIKDRSKIEFTESPEYRNFRLEILKRDNYTCQECGIRGKKGIRPILEVHHKKSRKNNFDLALKKDNCITLCRGCHKKTESYLNRWEDYTNNKAIKL